MSQLRQAMIKAMQLRNFSENTQKSYITVIKQLVSYYKRSPVNITEQEAQNYILHLVQEKKLSWSSCNVAVSSIRFFYKAILKKTQENFYLPHAKKEQHLPDILTRDEIKALLIVTKNHKHHAIFMTAYSAGLRVSEITNLTINDIDSQSNVICVRQGKGKKDRYVPLSPRLLAELREYWKLYRPSHWLFPGRDNIQPITRHAVTDAFKKAKIKADIKKNVSVHSLRHSFATHLLEAGTEIVNIKQLLGHSSISSTLRYTRISKQLVSSIASPLDSL
jgi:site-specific recombinase XerD